MREQPAGGLRVGRSAKSPPAGHGLRERLRPEVQRDLGIRRAAHQEHEQCVAVSRIQGVDVHHAHSCTTARRCDTCGHHSRKGAAGQPSEGRYRAFERRAISGTLSVMPQTVLIVDDHAGFRHAARALLEAEGFDVVGESATGGEGLADADRLRPDLVLLDVGLPDVDGMEVADQLDAHGRAEGRARLQPRRLRLSAALHALRRSRVHSEVRAVWLGARRSRRLSYVFVAPANCCR